MHNAATWVVACCGFDVMYFERTCVMDIGIAQYGGWYLQYV